MNPTMNASYKLLLTCSLTLLPMLGCDPASSPADEGEPLWTLRGSITSPEGVDAADELRVAFLWFGELESHDVVQVAQDLPVQPAFPSSFTVDLFEPPPAEAVMASEDFDLPIEGARLAVGAIVVYEDGDDDGELDLVPYGAPEFVDTVWASSMEFEEGDRNVLAVYLEADEPFSVDEDGARFTLSPGLNLLEWRMDDPPSLLPLGSAIELTLRDDFWVRTFACLDGVSEVRGSSGSGSAGLVDPSDVPSNLGPDACFCDEDGCFVWWQGECDEVWDGGVCGSVTVTCEGGSAMLQPGVEPPPSWPCEIPAA